jgi:hypothetical protein
VDKSGGRKGLKRNGDRIWAGPQLGGRRWSGAGHGCRTFTCLPCQLGSGRGPGRRSPRRSSSRGSRNSARIAALRATLQRRRVLPPVLPSAMLRFSAIGTADIRRSPRRKISVDQRAAARRGSERRSQEGDGTTLTVQSTQRYAHLLDDPLRAGLEQVGDMLRAKPHLVPLATATQ